MPPSVARAIPSVNPSDIFQPPVLKGMTVHVDNPLLFDFIVDQGQDKVQSEKLKVESEKLIKYFFASMTIPDKDAWVNLSPYERDRIVPDALGRTLMGQVMLEQDYALKRLAASLTNPETELGRRYWAEVELRTANHEQRGANNARSTLDVPRSSFSKVWIIPDGASVVEKDGFVFITDSKLKVMMEEDYLAATNDERRLTSDERSALVEPRSSVSTEVFREVVLPKLIEEVNTGKTFVPTRQVYAGVILATWYKQTLRDSLLGRIYADKSKTAGVETDEKDVKQKVYEQYLETFKKGVYNVIKEEETSDGDLLPRKYFSGGQIMKASLKRSPLAVSSASDIAKGQI